MDNVVRGLNYLKWLTRSQGARFLACRQAERACAWRFQSNGQGKLTDVPLLCGFIRAGTECNAEPKGRPDDDRAEA